MEVRSVETIVRTLNTAQVQYLIVGGLAVNAHGFVRLTRAVDIVLDLAPANAERGLNALLTASHPGNAGRLCRCGHPRTLAAGKEHDCPQTLERRTLAPPPHRCLRV